MDENAVVEAVCFRLKKSGCHIVNRLLTTQRGVDVEARNDVSGVEFFVEAKGGTSSRLGSPRFGLDYSQSQVFDRVAKGVFTCLELRAARLDRTKSRVILAVPEARWFRHYLAPLMADLKAAGIEIWFMAGEVGQPK